MLERVPELFIFRNHLFCDLQIKIFWIPVPFLDTFNLLISNFGNLAILAQMALFHISRTTRIGSKMNDLNAMHCNACIWVFFKGLTTLKMRPEHSLSLVWQQSSVKIQNLVLMNKSVVFCEEKVNNKWQGCCCWPQNRWRTPYTTFKLEPRRKGQNISTVELG